MRRAGFLTTVLFAFLTACSGGEVETDPGPDLVDGIEDEQASSTTTEQLVETVETTSTTTTAAGDGDGDADGTDGDQTTTTVIIDESSPQAPQYIELAASGLVLTLGEQACADEVVAAELDDGEARLDAIISGVTTCASPRAVDDFASVLISAGGSPLPPTEAACVSSELRQGDDYRPFWSALFDEEPFDFLAAPDDAQDRYLDLFATCVSVGRALSEQVGTTLSPATIGCIDDLYADSEFVRLSIEADLSAAPDDVARVNGQISTCLTPDEQDALGLG